MQNQNEPKSQLTEDATVISITTMESQLETVKKDFSSLFENSDFKKHMASMKRKYSGLKVESVEDKSVYEEIKKAISVVRPLRTELDKKVKAAKVDAKKYIKDVDELGDMFQAEIAKVEDPLWIEREKYESLLKEAEEKKKADAAKRLESRINDLITNGMVFDGRYYSIGEQISYGVQGIEELDDDKFNSLLEQVKNENEAILKLKREKEEADRLEAERQENLRKENERQKAELEKMKADMELEKKKIADAKKEIRQSKLAPYIQFIRDYSLVLSMEDDEFEKEFESIKIGAQQHWDFEKKKEEEAKEAAIRKEKEEKAKKEKEESDRKLLAERAIPYEELGFKHNYTKGTWGISIGDFLALEISKDGLLDGAIKYDEVKKQVEEAISKEEARLVEVEKQKEEARIKLMNEKDAFNDYIVRLLNVQAPILENEQLKKSIISITSLFKTID